ncbi:MAG: radical SAM protein [Candidatus Glassbacteria bacterium]
MARLVLCRPGLNCPAEKHWSRTPPLGIAYLASSARARGIEVAVVDGKMLGHSHPAETAEKILGGRPDFVGISSMTVEYPAARAIAARIKQARPDVITVIGGAHANALPYQTLQESPQFDYLFAGEAEKGLAELISGGPDSALGLLTRDNHTRKHHYESELADLPFPAWDLFPRTRSYPLLTERGCPYACVFCSRNSSGRVRSRPVEQVVEEIKWLLADFTPEEVRVEDETFGQMPGRAEKLLESFIAFKAPDVRFQAQTRVDCMSGSLATLMKRAGFEFVQLGVESGDPQVLKNSGKGITLGQVDQAVRTARAAGLKVWLKFIIGLPGETESSVRRSIELASRLNPERLSVAVIVAYPGSRVYEWAKGETNGYRITAKSWDRFDKYLSDSLELDTLSAGKLRRLQVRMYMETYLRNRRYAEFLRLVLRNFALAKTILFNAAIRQFKE